MSMDEFIALLESKSPPAPADQLAAFEAELGTGLPEDYRQFLIATNGGRVRGWYRYKGIAPDGTTGWAYINNVGGLREEWELSLRAARQLYQGSEAQIPRGLLWIMDDPGGNGICLGLSEPYRGRIYEWIHDELPDPQEWDGQVETAENILLLASSFADFVVGIGPRDDSDLE
jgi:hypothetical protein